MGVIKWGLAGLSLSLVALFAAKYTSIVSFLQAFDEVGNGYGARLACGAVLGAGRSLESVLGAELVFPPVKFGRTFTVDRAAGCVTVRAWWPWAAEASTACYRSHRLGCHIMPRGSSADMYPLPPMSPELDTAALEWPLGDKQDAGSLAAASARVDLRALKATVDAHFEDSRLHARAFLLLVDGQIVFERYGDDCDASTSLLGWSASKSVVNALVALRVQEGAMDLAAPLAASVAAWRGLPQLQSLTVEQALRMQDGLDVDEAYVPGGAITDMLFVGASVEKVVKQAAETGRRARGEGCFHYSSATTNALARALAGTFETAADALRYPTEALFRPLGARSFRLEASADGSFVGSSFGWATGRDWARLGLLYLWDGLWWEPQNGAAAGTGAGEAKRTRRMLPEGWVGFSSQPTATSRGSYGAHFWLGGNNTAAGDESAAGRARSTECDRIFPTRLDPDRNWLRHAFPQGTFLMHGFEEQCVAIHPGSGVVMVRLGASKEVVLKWDKVRFYQQVFAAVK